MKNWWKDYDSKSSGTSYQVGETIWLYLIHLHRKVYEGSDQDIGMEIHAREGIILCSLLHPKKQDRA